MTLLLIFAVVRLELLGCVVVMFKKKKDRRCLDSHCAKHAANLSQA